MEKLREVRLYGIAGARFGRVHRLAVSSTAEAVRALSVLIPGFRKFLLAARDNGLTFAVFNGRRNLGEDDLGAPVGGDAIRERRPRVHQKIAGAPTHRLGPLPVQLAHPPTREQRNLDRPK